MTLPATPIVKINLTGGASFGDPFVLDTSELDFAILAEPNTIVVDVSSQVSKIDTRKERNLFQDKYQSGTATVRIIDETGAWNPQNNLSPYWPNLVPLRSIIIETNYSGTIYPIFKGYITEYRYTYPTDQELGYVDLICSDAFRLVFNSNVTTVTGATAGDLSGVRVNEILDEISWPATMRDIDTGLTTLQADPGTNRTALGALFTVAESEYGAIYVDASGSFVFQDRNVTVSSIGATPTLFADDGTGIEYADAAWILNDTLVFNKATITRLGGTAQVASNQPSIDKYFLHSYFLDELLMQTDAVALDYARAYVASRAETSIRCDAIVLDLYTPNYSTGVVAALDLDFFDPITVITTQPGGSTIEKTLQIFGVRMNITPNSWRTTFTTLEPVIDGFIIGNIDYGVLGQNVLSY